MTSRHPIKKHCFEKIKELGIPINTILDVGVLTGTPELMQAFPDKPHLLFEPIDNWYPAIGNAYTSKKIDFQLFEMAVSNRDGTINLETATVRKELTVTHARITNSNNNNTRTVPTRRLDTLLPELSYQSPYLLKIDVDGAEIDILEGAQGILELCNVIVIEANIKNLPLRLNAVSQAGFTLFDIVDICYYEDRLRQVDLVLTNNAMMDSLRLDMYKMPFDINKWKGYEPSSLL
jgi:FkbM family methyltransferase